VGGGSPTACLVVIGIFTASIYPCRCRESKNGATRAVCYAPVPVRAMTVVQLVLVPDFFFYFVLFTTGAEQ
jgi:hypothetical protein